MLTAKLVFEADNTLQLIAKHMQAEPVQPSKRTSNPIPAALEQLVLTCLAKDPKNRPQSAAYLAEALAAIDAEPWSEEQALDWWNANAGSDERMVGSVAAAHA
jgi:hypothetical protein